MSSKKHAPKTDLELLIAEIRAEEKLAIKAIKQVTEQEIKELNKSDSSSSREKKRKTKQKRQKAAAAAAKIKARKIEWAKRIRAAKHGKVYATFGDFDAPKPKPTRTSGPFDSFGAKGGYEGGGAAAGNRIERKHKGFYNAVKDLPDILKFIFFVYSYNFHDAYKFYEIHGDDYVDEDRYEVLVRLIAQEYGVEVLV